MTKEKKETSAKKTFIIGIMHCHGSEYSTTIGKIDVNTDDEAELEKSKECIQKWIDNKKKEHRCESYGDQCGIDVREAGASMKSVMLLCSAEEIKEE